MCLAIPMKIVKIEGKIAIAEVDGVKREINLGLLENINLGDYVIVHAGFAIQKLDTKEAQESLNLLKKVSILKNEQ